MLLSSVRSTVATCFAVLLLIPSLLAFESPLSPEAVREAYFLGQRRDETMAHFLNQYTKSLPPPATGPYISAVTFLTPFAQLVQYSSRRLNYSAQQAALDHRSHGEEIVQIFVEIQLTESYGRLILAPAGPPSKSPSAFVLRPSDFWKDFHTRFYNGEAELSPAASHGYANFSCGRSGPCILTGATLEFDFPAEDFDSDTATVDIAPPEGDPVSLDFGLNSLR